MNFIKTLLASLLGSFISGFLLIFVFFMMLGSLFKGGGNKEFRAKPNSVLSIDLSGEIKEKGSGFDLDLPEGSPFNIPPAIGLWEIREALEKAKEDENIIGVMLSPGSMETGWATLNSIREALLDFKASGKFIYAHADMYNEATYYLASTADKVFLTPQGGIEFNGFASTPMFYKGLLDKLEIEPRIFKVGTFKSAVEPYILDKMSDANRLQVQTYLNDLWSVFAENVATSRNTTVEKLNQLADTYATSNDPAVAVSAGLVDQLAYKDEVLALLMEKTGTKTSDEINVVKLNKYSKFPVKQQKKDKKQNKIGVVIAQGQIVDGKGSEDQIGGATLSAQIRKLREDSTVKAVVLRVNSPGGSALASDIIWREVVLTKKVKPVIVSMGDLAASGGYYISAAADRIFAQPNTITGSIGVFGMMFGAQDLMKDKVGITFDRVTTHNMADMGNLMRDMTEEEAGRIQKSVEKVYGTFVNIVKEGRNFPDSVAVDSIAQGRVWSGVKGKEIGLVDEIGDLNAAIKYAAEKAQLGDDYSLKVLPEKKDPFEEFLTSLAESKISIEALAPEFREQFQQIRSASEVLNKNGVYALMPYTIKID